jgi:hypothetical protein
MEKGFIRQIRPYGQFSLNVLPGLRKSHKLYNVIGQVNSRYLDQKWTYANLYLPDPVDSPIMLEPDLYQTIHKENTLNLSENVVHPLRMSTYGLFKLHIIMIPIITLSNL